MEKAKATKKKLKTFDDKGNGEESNNDSTYELATWMDSVLTQFSDFACGIISPHNDRVISNTLIRPIQKILFRKMNTLLRFQVLFFYTQVFLSKFVYF